MNKVAEFYAKAMEDEATAAEFAEAMGGKSMNELGDAEETSVLADFHIY